MESIGLAIASVLYLVCLIIGLFALSVLEWRGFACIASIVFWAWFYSGTPYDDRGYNGSIQFVLFSITIANIHALVVVMKGVDKKKHDIRAVALLCIVYCFVFITFAPKSVWIAQEEEDGPSCQWGWVVDEECAKMCNERGGPMCRLLCAHLVCIEERRPESPTETTFNGWSNKNTASGPLPRRDDHKECGCAPGEVIVTRDKWCIGPEVPPKKKDVVPPQRDDYADLSRECSDAGCVIWRRDETRSGPAIPSEIKDVMEKIRQSGSAIVQPGKDGIVTISSKSDPSLRVRTDPDQVFNLAREPDPLPTPEPIHRLKEVHETLEKIRQTGAVHAREEIGMMTITSVSDPSLTVTTDTQTVYDWREKRSRPNIVEYRYRVIETWDEMAKRFGEQVCITETIDWAESVLFCRDRCDKEESTNRFHFSTCWERCLNIIL